MKIITTTNEGADGNTILTADNVAVLVFLCVSYVQQEVGAGGKEARWGLRCLIVYHIQLPYSLHYTVVVEQGGQSYTYVGLATERDEAVLH